MLHQKNSHWYHRRQLGAGPANPDLRNLLFASGSLTRHLRRRCGGALELTLVAQRWQRPWQSERQLLDLASGRYALIREVSMACRGRPWLYARTLLPPQTLRGTARRLLTIGQRPLGALLFGAPGRLSIQRLRRDYARLDRNSLLYQRISELISGIEQPLWARRTVYLTHAMRFAVIEVFLPEAFQQGS